MRLLALPAVVVSLLLTLPAQAQTETVLVTQVSGPVTPVVADHLAAGVQEAAAAGHQAFLVELDTPGGLDTSMRDIVQAFLNAPVPVIVYVSPSGARAASAGTFITMAAHVAAMAPGTTIGAATPVDLGGGEITDKIINDAAAFAVTVAEARGRNVGFAEDAVREGSSISASRALQIGAVDVVASGRRQLLDQLEGEPVTLGSGQETILRTADAASVPYRLSFFRRVLQRLADPNLAFLLMSLGTLAVIYELANPGMGLGGIMGVIMLILAFFSLSVLPVNAAGVALIVLAAGLLIAELFVPGVGVFAAGGVIALVLGGVFLFEGTVGVSPVVLVPVGLVTGAGTLLAGRLAWRARRAPAALGREALVGRLASISTGRQHGAQVFLDGAWWRVRSRSDPLRPQQTVRVVGMEGLELIVEPTEEEST
ncbi:MAG: nodulation protein NfeD [Actinomycetota bacterium]|nr:nodulation protein NfeD [Actinomycetota bacterium]